MLRPSEQATRTHLNSIWLEGVLVADPVDSAVQEGRKACSFEVEAAQNWEPPSIFLVEATESALDGCRARLGRGRGVRIIGRLHQDRWIDPEGILRKDVKIVSELVEPLGLSV